MKGQKKSYILIGFILISFFPFLMKLGIKPEELQKNAVLELYYKWKWKDPEISKHKGEAIFFQADPKHPILSDVFLTELSKDFMVDPKAENNFLKLYFSVDSHLRLRIETNIDSQKQASWYGHQRIVNNGIIAAPWLATLMLILGFSLATSLVVSLIVLILWTSGWSLVGAIAYFYQEFSQLFMEVFYRFQFQDWQLWSVKSFCIYSTLCILLVSFLVAGNKKIKGTITQPLFLYLPFLLEFPILYFSGKWNNWSSDINPGKIYFASLAYRFMLYSFLFYFWGLHKKVKAVAKRAQLNLYSFLFPFVLVLSGLSIWISSVIIEYSHESLFRLKIFFISLVLSFVIGNRLLAMLLMGVIFANTRIPELGHWTSGLEWAFLFEGVFAGWLLSPFKFYKYQSSIWQHQQELFTLILISAVMGVFLSSMGAPLYFSWILLFTANWALLQVNGRRLTV